MSSNTDTSKLDDLIVTTIDSVKGYEHSAQKADSEKFAELLSALAEERQSIVTMLQEQSRALGGEPSDFGSAAATIHRRFEDLRLAMGGSDAAIVKEIERGENYLKEEFERALKDDEISMATRARIDRCYQIVVAGRIQIEQLDVERPTLNHENAARRPSAVAERNVMGSVAKRLFIQRPKVAGMGCEQHIRCRRPTDDRLAGLYAPGTLSLEAPVRSLGLQGKRGESDSSA